MENIYSAYTKLVDNKTYYFVKKFIVFRDIPGIEPVQESYGMHTDFNKACSIAGVNDLNLRAQLLKEANATLSIAKVVDFNHSGFSGKNMAM